MTQPVIEVKNLSKQYSLEERKISQTFRDKFSEFASRRFSLKQNNSRKGTFWALKDVSFHVAAGEIVGIVGKNGAGKSTLLKILSRISEPTTGLVTLRGQSASLLEVGTGFHPDLSGRENIYLNGTILGMKKKEIDLKFDEIVTFAEVEKFLDMPVKHYSSGMYVRLAFAIAAHLEPEIMMIDEVLAVGDVSFQKKCLNRLNTAAKSGRTIFFVSHNLTAIRGLCTRALLFQKGLLMADGKPDEVIGRYVLENSKSAFVKDWQQDQTAPQNSTIFLKKVSLVGLKGEPIGSLTTDIPFNVEIIFEVKTKNSAVGLTIILNDSENNCVLSSINNHEPNWYDKKMPAGLFKAICMIPAYLLNSGIFNLSLNLFSGNYTDSKIVADVLSFEILDGAHVRGDYYGEYRGYIRPLLDWKTEVWNQAVSYEHRMV